MLATPVETPAIIRSARPDLLVLTGFAQVANFKTGIARKSLCIYHPPPSLQAAPNTVVLAAREAAAEAEESLKEAVALGMPERLQRALEKRRDDALVTLEQVEDIYICVYI